MKNNEIIWYDNNLNELRGEEALKHVNKIDKRFNKTYKFISERLKSLRKYYSEEFQKASQENPVTKVMTKAELIGAYQEDLRIIDEYIERQLEYED